MSKPILFFGNEKLATGIKTEALIFKGLIDSGYEIKALIISQPIDDKVKELEVVKTAIKHNIPIKSYQNLKQSVDELRSFNVDIAILAAFGKIIPQEILDIFSIGIINIHPSLLPKHRGPTPIEGVILNGDSQTGVSIIRLTASMDEGPIYKQASIKLNGIETKQQLSSMLDNLGKDLLLNSIEDIISGKITAIDQPHEGASYDKLIRKTDGIINWHTQWLNIDRQIRAYSGWPKTRFKLKDIDITLLKAHFYQKLGQPGKVISFNQSLAIYCQDGLVVIDSLIPAGAKIMSGQDFLLGYGNKITN